MRCFNDGRIRHRASFLRRLFLQDEGFPFTNVLDALVIARLCNERPSHLLGNSLRTRFNANPHPLGVDRNLRHCILWVMARTGYPVREVYSEGGARMPANDKDRTQITVPVKYIIPPSIVSRLANQVTIHADQAGWYLNFFEAIPPFFAGTPDEIRSQLEKVEEVSAECVARVFIPFARVQDFLSAIESANAFFRSLTHEDSK
jgi:hypothetical protein